MANRVSCHSRDKTGESVFSSSPPTTVKIQHLVCPTCRREIHESDSVCAHCLQPLIPVQSESGHSIHRMATVGEGMIAGKVFWVVFFIGIVMAMVLGFPEWFWGIKPETKQLGLMKMAYGTGAALLFAFIGFAVTRGNRRYD